MDPYFLISITILGIVGFFGFMLVAIVALKWRRQRRENRIRQRRDVLEPRILEYGRAEAGSVQEFLEGIRKSGDEEPLQRIFTDHIRAVRGRVRERLVRACEDLGLVDRSVGLLDSHKWWVRAEAAENLGQMRSPKAVEPLDSAMDDPISDVRIRAAQALGSIGGRTAVSKLVAFLMQPSRWSGIRIAEILSTMGEETVEDLIREFNDIPLESRPLAIDILGRVRSLTAIPLLLELLRDENDDVRARAANALGQIGDPNHTGALLEALEDDAWQVRAVAAKALGRLSGTESVEALCRALTDSQWWVRANSAEALRAKGEDGHRALVSMLDSGDAYAREQAVFMLEASGVLDSYVDQLNSKKVDDRSRSVDFIRKLISLGRTDRLSEAARLHPDRNVREDLASLLGLSPAGSAGGTP